MSRHLFLTVILLLVALSLPGTATAHYFPGNGFVSPAPGEVLRGIVPIEAIADNANFQKWQLDILPAGNTQATSFVALGETPLPAGGLLTRLDTARFPDGNYSLRLRIVSQDGNYDEFHVRMAIANNPAGYAPPASTARTRVQRAVRLGLPTHTGDGAPILYLTFDDGPSPEKTAAIVDLLDRHGARGTFFVVGAHLNRWPRALRPVAGSGHMLANHTYRHRSLVGADLETFARELARVEDLIQETTGDLLPADNSLRLLRAPYGAVDASTFEMAANLGYQVVGWDLDPKDWRRPGKEAIVRFVTERAFPGAIVILHDGGGGSWQTVEALEVILTELGERGYRFHGMESAGESRTTAQTIPE
ncbi:MAG: polysaccharide deacetylase family protein [Chloroflexota bacterium]|nr:polysaccharide deacetylase family protein [Chloroflexota bacterium]